MRLRIILILLALTTALMVTPSPATTQDEVVTCPVLVQQALDQMGSNCTQMGRNSACYGFNRVDATFTAIRDETFFSLPADRARLDELQTIATVPLDTALEYWGIAVMSVQANVPRALPGQAVVFMLMGDTQVENAVAPENSLVLDESLNVTTRIATSIRSGPSDQANTIGGVTENASLIADGISPDGLWLRVLYQLGPGWVAADALNLNSQVGALPIIRAESRTPMQSFYFRTAFNAVSCDEAPSLLAIQSPEGMEVDLTANGVNIRIGSLITLRVVDETTIEVATLKGNATLNPDTPQAINIPAGQASRSTPGCLGQNASGQWTATPGCTWQPPMPLDGMLPTGTTQTILSAFDIFTGSQDSEYVEVDDGICLTGERTVYTVREGDSLFRIGRLFNTNVGALMVENTLDTTIIVPGQELDVVCGVLGPSSLPPLGSPPPNQPVTSVDEIDCSALRATSPVAGLTYGSQQFFWDPLPTPPDLYRVRVWGQAGGRVFETTGAATNLIAQITDNSVGTGISFNWSVEAVVGGAVICQTPPISLMRAVPGPGGSSNNGVIFTPTPPTPDDDGPVVQPPGPIGELNLTSMCSNDPDIVRTWRVRNPNPFPVNVNWRLTGGPAGTITAAASGDTFFDTGTVPGGNNNNTMIITWVNDGQPVSITKASGAARCGTNPPPPPPPPSPEEQCRNSGGTWTDGQCIFPPSPQQICESQGGTWTDGQCVFPPSPQQICESQGGTWTETGCIFPPSPEQQSCEAEGGTWTETGCVFPPSPEQQSCEAEGGTWTDGQCRFPVSTEELSCQTQGGFWLNGRCWVNTGRENPPGQEDQTSRQEQCESSGGLWIQLDQGEPFCARPLG